MQHSLVVYRICEFNFYFSLRFVFSNHGRKLLSLLFSLLTYFRLLLLEGSLNHKAIWFMYSFCVYLAEIRRKHTSWYPRVTAIPIICNEGFLEIGIHRETTNGDLFLQFVNKKLVPNLLVNHRSVVIMGITNQFHFFLILQLAVLPSFPPFLLSFFLSLLVSIQCSYSSSTTRHRCN